MRKIACDKCEAEERVVNHFALPKGWCEIKIEAAINKTLNSYGRRVQYTLIFCNDCATKSFSFEDEEKLPIEAQVHNIVSDYISDLAVDAVQEAMDNA